MIMSVEKMSVFVRAWLAILLAGVFTIQPAAADNALGLVRIQSLLDFNAILITEVDVVFVYDEATAAALPATKGGWYAQKYDLLKDGPAELKVVTTSVPQGFDSATLIMPENSASAVRVFAVGYHEAQGTAVHDLTAMTSALIEIDQLGLRVSGK